MIYVNKFFFIPLIYIGVCHASTDISSESDFKKLILCVNNGNNVCLEKITHHTKRLNFEQSIILRDTLAHSLIKSPSATIDVLNSIDKETTRTGHSFIRDNYGTDIVCAYMINSNKYDRESFFKYYSIAKNKLEKTGGKGKTCLDMMKSSVEETIYEEKRGKMKWGKEKYPF